MKKDKLIIVVPFLVFTSIFAMMLLVDTIFIKLL
jgi:hypothetical protein